eukprot:gene5151-34964_t
MEPIITGAMSAGIGFLDGFLGANDDSSAEASFGRQGGAQGERSLRDRDASSRLRSRSGSDVGDTGGEAGALSTAEEAEQHRLNQRTVLNLQAALVWLHSSAPYFILLLLTFVAYHCVEIWMVAWMLKVVFWSNHSLSQQIALRSNFKPHECLGLLAYVTFNSWIVIFLTAGIKDGRLWQYFMLRIPHDVDSIVDACFLVIMADSLVRLWSVIPKIAVLLLHQSKALRHYRFPSSVATTVWGGMSSRGGGGGSSGSDGLEFCVSRAAAQEGRLLTLLEYISRTYRLVLPTGVWTHILLHSVSGGSLLCSLFVGVYLTLKLFALIKHFHLLKLSARSVLRNGAVHGRYTTRDELQELGSAICPICQDNVNKVKI